MKTRIILGISLILTMFGQLAAQTFQKEYDFGFQEEVVESILLSNNQSLHFVAIGSSFDDYSPVYEDCSINKLDSSGLLIGSFTISNFYALDVKSFNDTIAINGLSLNLSTLRKSLTFFLDTALNVLDTIEVQDSLKVILPASQMEINSNNHLIQLVTELDTSNFNLTSKVLEFSKTGALVNQQIYDNTGNINNLNGGGIYFNSTINKYFIVQTGSFNQNSMNSGSIHRLNSNYQIEKSLPLNTGIVDTVSFDTSYLGGPFYLKELANGNMVVCGNFDQLYFNLSALPVSFNEAGLIVYDTNLNRLNVQTVTTADTSDVPGYQAIVSDSNYIYWVCNTNWSYEDYYVPETTHFRIIKMDLNGNYISERNYSNGKFTKINSIIRMPDNGFMLSGSTYDSINNFSEGLNAYILRLDSTGNLISGLNENKLQELTKNDVLVYPNPASDVINFQKINYFEAYQLSIYDVNGKEMEHLNWNSDKKQLSISDFPRGIYFYTVQGEKTESFSGKFIKE